MKRQQVEGGKDTFNFFFKQFVLKERLHCSVLTNILTEVCAGSGWLCWTQPQTSSEAVKYLVFYLVRRGHETSVTDQVL